MEIICITPTYDYKNMNISQVDLGGFRWDMGVDSLVTITIAQANSPMLV